MDFGSGEATGSDIGSSIGLELMHLTRRTTLSIALVELGFAGLPGPMSDHLR
jgi:hypothetical protein